MSNTENVTKKRKRSPEEQAEKALQRSIRNRISAQESRDRQKKYVKELEDSNKELKETNEALLARLSALEEQNQVMLQKLEALSSLVPMANSVPLEVVTPMSLSMPSPTMDTTLSTSLPSPTMDTGILDTLSTSLPSPSIFQGSVEDFFAQFQSSAPSCYDITPLDSEPKSFEELFQDYSFPDTVDGMTLIEKPELQSDPEVVRTSQQQMNSHVSLMCHVLKAFTPLMLLASSSKLFKRERHITLNVSRWNQMLQEQYPLCYSVLKQAV